jgi:hypothetical protein
MTLLDVMATEGGFTHNPRADELLRAGEATGYAIAVPGTERVAGNGPISREEFADAFVSLVRSYGTCWAREHASAAGIHQNATST